MPRNAIGRFVAFFVFFHKKERKTWQSFVIFEKVTIFALAIADMAQLVEQRIRNAWVPGSSPGIGSNKNFNFAVIAQLVEH